MNTLHKVKQERSSKKKQDILKGMSDVEELLLRYTFDNKIKFGIKDKVIMKSLGIDNINGYEDIGEYFIKQACSDNKTYTISEPCVGEIKDFLDNAIKLSGKKLEEHIRLYFKFESMVQTKVWVVRTLLKDLRLGMAKRSVNKVFNELGKEEFKDHIVQLGRRVYLHNSKTYIKKKKQFVEVFDVKFPRRVETKLNGFRSWTSVKLGEVKSAGLMGYNEGEQGYIVKITSRQDEDATAYCPEIVEQVKEWAKLNNITEEVILDGEVYDTNGFNGIQKRLLRKPENIEHCSSLKLGVYDIVKLRGYDTRSVPFGDRVALLDKSFKYTEGVHRVKFAIAHNYEDVINFYNQEVADGQEGIMSKDLNQTYATESKHSRKGVDKIKPEFEGTFEIVNVSEGTGRNAGKLNSLTVVDKSRTLQVDVTNGLTDDDVDLITTLGKEEFIGKFIDVGYDGVKEIKEMKSLEHPRFITFRNDKSEADDYAN